MKNAHLLSNDQVDFSKTKTTKIAYEKIGKDLYREVHLVEFVEKNGKRIAAVTVNDASRGECSESGVAVYVISQSLGGF